MSPSISSLLCWGLGWGGGSQSSAGRRVHCAGGRGGKLWGTEGFTLNPGDGGGGALGTAGRGGEGTPSLTPTHCDPQQPPPQSTPGTPDPNAKSPSNRMASLSHSPPPSPPLPPTPIPPVSPSPPLCCFLREREGRERKEKKKEKRSQTPKQEAGACFASQAIFLEPIGMRTHPAPLPN